ncbi:MAG: preprotein translocase subunit SecA [Phycisphaera sp.]|nr:preprotein translocase subunit SecA [Phycisphaera sp.]
MVLNLITSSYTRIFGSRNDRMVKSYRKRVEQINALEPEIRLLTDAQLREKTQAFRKRLADGEPMSTVLPEALAVAREAMDRSVGIRNIFDPEKHFDPTKLPSDLQKTYQRIAEHLKTLQPTSVLGGEAPVPVWHQADIPIELYNAVREIYPQSRPPFRARPFDVQLIGGMVLSQGRIAEMKTGEGKTIVAPLACYLACLEGHQCHVVTVNDYLVQRDRDWVFPFYHHLGLTVGAIHPFHMQPPEGKANAYKCNVVYGTNSEFGFDYLRDNMKLSTNEQVQKRRDFCIVDEIDSILIDEARTPLIISGPAHEDAPRYGLADQVARHLMQKQREYDSVDNAVQQCIMRFKGLEGDIRNSRDKEKIPAMREEMKRLQEQELPRLEEARDKHTQYYEVERDKKASHLTHEGVAEAQKIANIGSFYVGNNVDFPHLLENALRAHVIYQRDKDYVVQNGEVIIVDEFTGRLMIGRQWSDGLHQAVEAKEGVKIKQETQTLATVTIQNFFKLYKRLAGMTGTALTEANEFDEIYKLDVVSIPTNVPVVRVDRNDLIFLSEKDKWNAILEEIKRTHDVGRPVLVGTTSVEKSEYLAQLLAKRHGIKHEVLNAKQHEREAHIVEHAGELGAVMIATNMAGRGTDIKLQPIARDVLIHHWQQRNVLPKQAKPEDDDATIIRLAYRHLASRDLGLKPKDVEAMSDEQIRLALLRHWTATETYTDPDKVGKMTAEQCEKELDKAPGFMLHKLKVFTHTEDLGGLHIVGTERHESRRIDNQLRGRAGRQGDNGSSRFFISLEDDLMKLFAGKTTMTALSKLGMKEGDAIEHKWITGSVERAQRKVEERNFEVRKNLLEYDEVMEYQRNAFYGIRQEVLEGRNVRQIIFDYIGESIDDAVARFLDRDYVPSQVSEWCRGNLDVMIEAFRLRADELDELQESVRSAARNEVAQTVELTLGEYMSDEAPPEEWDLRGLAQWAMSRFSVNLSQTQLRSMNTAEVRKMLVEHATELVDRKDLSGLEKFVTPLYAQKQLAEWAKQKFNVELDPKDLEPKQGEKTEAACDRVSDHILDKARQAYAEREVRYPIEFVLEFVFNAAQQDPNFAGQQLVGFVKQRFELDWDAQKIGTTPPQQMFEELVKENHAWLREGKLEKTVDEQLASLSGDTAQLYDWATRRFGPWKITEAQLGEMSDEEKREALIEHGRSLLRTECEQLERFVLLQILDTAWKDHLYMMDQLRDSVGMRSIADKEKDPRVVYKSEGAGYFRQMQQSVRDKVTELAFRARLTANFQARNVYQEREATHAEARNVVQQAAAAQRQGTAEQRENMAAAERAGGPSGGSGGGEPTGSRKQRRAAAARERKGGGSRKRPRGR